MSNFVYNPEHMDAQLKGWGLKLDGMAKKLETAVGFDKVEISAKMSQLGEKHQQASRKLSEAKQANGEKWESIKDDMAAVWLDIESSFKRLID